MFHGFDFDSTMLRIGSMNMLLHGVEAPDIRYRDSLSEGAGDEEGIYSLILANPPFAGSLDYETTAQNLLRVVKTKKTELLFLALFLRLLRPGGRRRSRRPDHRDPRGGHQRPTKGRSRLRSTGHTANVRFLLKTGMAGRLSKSPWPLIRRLHEERFSQGPSKCSDRSDKLMPNGGR